LVSDLRVCAKGGEPLVFTFEFPGGEYLCVLCRRVEDLFGARAPASPERVQRHADLTEQYERERSERTGRPYVAPALVGNAGVVAPTCVGCGQEPPAGTPLIGGKPQHWYSRTVGGVTSYACSRTCIPEREAVLPW
jgi:hypothetical protein